MRRIAVQDEESNQRSHKIKTESEYTRNVIIKERRGEGRAAGRGVKSRI